MKDPHISKGLHQNPSPGSSKIFCCGDSITFTLTLPKPRTGQAWLRTNLGNRLTRNNEIIEHVENGSAILARDWNDIPMKQVDDCLYSITLPLTQTGRFEAKAFYLSHNRTTPAWPEGNNTIIKVEPAYTCAANTIYSAFVRQFGPSLSSEDRDDERERVIEEMEEDGYTVIPRSGTFRDLIKHLDFIIDELRFNIVQLLPIHPTPTTYAKMGRFGSPFASLDFMDVDPALATFDKMTTPMDQFIELVDAVHKKNARIFIDIPVNHTGWASHLQIHHPDWFARDDDQSFMSPGAWGVVWADLSKLDYKSRNLQKHMAEVFLFWCKRGVDGFRCDAGYKIPFSAWEYIIAKVRNEFPDAIFMLEGLGGHIDITNKLLMDAGMDWAYSELFQNYDRQQISDYLPTVINTSKKMGTLINFAETHDNNRLADTSDQYSILRTSLSALCSLNGAFGITNGVEWLATEKVDVHEARSLNWNSEKNIVNHITRLNSILECCDAFYNDSDVKLIDQQSRGNSIMLLRTSKCGNEILVLANLDHENESEIRWNAGESSIGSGTQYDLVSGKEVQIDHEGESSRVTVPAGEVLCISSDPVHLDLVNNAGTPGRPQKQMLRAKTMEIVKACHGLADISEIDIEEEAECLRVDPLSFYRKTAEQCGQSVTAISHWKWTQDLHRTFIIPAEHFLLITCPFDFQIEIRDNNSTLRTDVSMPTSEGSFILTTPFDVPEKAKHITLHLTIFEPEKTQKHESPLLLLPEMGNAIVTNRVDNRTATERDIYALCTNGLGAMSQVRSAWGTTRSKYDAILAANMHPDYPTDRQIMFARCRAWLVYRGYSQSISIDNLDDFSLNDDNSVSWHFTLPSGMGKTVPFTIRLKLVEGMNRVTIDFHREHKAEDPSILDKANSIKLILRPDIDDRNFHETTKAFDGPEAKWQHLVNPKDNGFSFSPSGNHCLHMTSSSGSFIAEPEWMYMIHHPVEEQRGMDHCTDLFSPGYFEIDLTGNQSATLQADVMPDCGSTPEITDPLSSSDLKKITSTDLPLDEAMHRAIKDYIVKRDDSLTVIAGYPWFLDWGRDTLICLRGIIQAGMHDEARDILRQFAMFEKDGTLPNMIRGNDDNNRDTSDAPLWFFVACADLMKAENSSDLLSLDCRDRTIRDALQSIANSYISGTSNGIKMDIESGLIFSPSHYTWMDTNHPAGTPRTGYPIEIQALWFSALTLMNEIDDDGKWKNLADQVSNSITSIFSTEHNYLSDCLHTSSFKPAHQAEPDDAVRSNQLLAITLGAITDNDLCRSIISACSELVVPGAIRSLADRSVKHPLPVMNQGKLLNNPDAPYWGHYSGDEDNSRKPAYHNGTAWSWMFPSYSEALHMTYGQDAVKTALSILASSTVMINQGCIGHTPEINDGNSPHTPRGCGAQAWGVTELYRVISTLKADK